MNNKILAIILNWNGISTKYKNKSILIRSIETLNVTEPNLKLLVVDAESIDNSIDYLASQKIEYLRVKNKGWAYCNNIAIKHGINKYNPKYILLLNNDLIFNKKNWLLNMVNAFRLDNAIGIVGCELKYPNGKIQHASAFLNKRFGIIEHLHKKIKNNYVYSVTGAVILIKKDVFDKIGYFDEIYSPFNFEETDFCRKAYKKGIFTYYISSTNITHLGNYSIGNEKVRKKWNKNKLLEIYIRNNQIFLRKHEPQYVFKNIIYWLTASFIAAEPKFHIRGIREIATRLKITLNAIKIAKEKMRSS